MWGKSHVASNVRKNSAGEEALPRLPDFGSFLCLPRPLHVLARGTNVNGLGFRAGFSARVPSGALRGEKAMVVTPYSRLGRRQELSLQRA